MQYSHSSVVQIRESLVDLTAQLDRVVKPYVAQIYPLQETLKRISERLKCSHPVLKVGVFGPPGSGKSTLLGALCGNDLFPRNAAKPPDDCETYMLVRVRHAAMPAPVLVIDSTDQLLARGVNNVNARLREENEAWRQSRTRPSGGRSVTPPRMMTDCLRIDSAFAAFAKGVNPEVALEFTEVPPGGKLSNSKVSSIAHSFKTVETQFHWDVMVYVMDYADLGTEAEQGLFCEIVDEHNPRVMEHARDRVFFVVNKADEQVPSGRYLRTPRGFCLCTLCTEETPPFRGGRHRALATLGDTHSAVISACVVCFLLCVPSVNKVYGTVLQDWPHGCLQRPSIVWHYLRIGAFVEGKGAPEVTGC